MKKARWLFTAVLSACMVIVLADALAVRGHVDNKLRFGFRRDPIISALAHLTEIYIEAVSPYSIDLMEFDDSFSLHKAIMEEDIDVALEYPAEAWARTACPSRGALMINIFPLMKSYYREEYGAVWVGMFNLRKENLLCYAPSYVITRGVAEDLAYYTLPDYLKKLIGVVTEDDMNDMLRDISKGETRTVLTEYLAGKDMI